MLSTNIERYTFKKFILGIKLVVCFFTIEYIVIVTSGLMLWRSSKLQHKKLIKSTGRSFLSSQLEENILKCCPYISYSIIDNIYQIHLRQ